MYRKTGGMQEDARAVSFQMISGSENLVETYADLRLLVSLAC